jgi:predicted enzyme related to lactoylglutathione lyase
MTHKHFITHIEFSARDLKETKKFYADVFDWMIRDFPEMNYATFEAEGGSGGGFNPVTEDSPAGRVLVYINTPDLKDTVRKIKQAGGKIILESYEIPGVGFMATFLDPTENLVALLQPMMGESTEE